jgi:pimeloyl-ACP methyl ester carboxylesterase
MLKLPLTANQPINAVVIGGLIVNVNPLKQLLGLFSQVKFIDINCLSFEEARQQALSHLNHCENPAVLIGYSLGGLVALSLEQLLAPTVKLILLNALPFFLSEPNWIGIKLANYAKILAKFKQLSLAQFCDHFICLALYPDIPSFNHRLSLVSQYVNTKKINHWLTMLATTDLRQQFNTIQRPTLLILSIADTIVPSSNSLTTLWVRQLTLSNSTHAKLNFLQINPILHEFLAC